MLLFVVAVGWALVLVSWLRSRSETRGVNSITSFSRHLSVLERTSPARQALVAVDESDEVGGRRPLSYSPLQPLAVHRPRRPGRMTLTEARRRRRDVLVALAAATVVLGGLALTVGSAFIALFVVALVALGGYLGLLVRAQRIGAEREAKVRFLPTPAPVEVSSSYWLQQSAN